MSSSLTLFMTALLASLAAVSGTRRLAIRFQIGSLPTARKIHEGFRPVLGGLGIFFGMLIGVMAAVLLGILPVTTWVEHWHFWAGVAIILLTGLIDDVRGVSPLQKFGGQFLAALVIVSGGCCIEAFYSPDGSALSLQWFVYPFSILWIMFIINAVNLLDGLDGLAGGVSLIIMIGFLILSIVSGNGFLIVLAISVVGGLLGFLKFNYHPASIFMGDTGSLMLGFVLAYFSVESLKIANSLQIYFLASLVMLGMPITDTLISFFRRMGRGDHPFKPDREHFHHRLIKLSFSHIDSVWLMYYFTLLYVTLGVLMVIYRDFAGTILFFLAMGFSVFWAWRLGYLETRGPISFGVDERESRATLRPMLHVDRIWHQITLLLGDMVAINIALFLTYWFRFQSGMMHPISMRTLQEYFMEPVFLVVTLVWLLLFWLNGLYRMGWDVSRYEQMMRVAKVVSFGSLILLFLISIDMWVSDEQRLLFNQDQLKTLGFYWMSMIALVGGIRLLIIRFEKQFHLFEYTYKNTLLIGTTRRAKNILRDINSNPHLLYKVVGVIDRTQRHGEFHGVPILGSYDDLSDLIQQQQIQEIIVAIPESDKRNLLHIIGVCDRLQVVVKTIPALQAIVSGGSKGFDSHGLVRVFPEHLSMWQWIIKRAIDISLAGLVLLLQLPVWAVLAVMIKLRFRKSVFVKLPILGKNGQVFKMFLFRTAAADSEALPDAGAAAGTKDELGEWLRRTQVYKFPQLINILLGHMSLVGPRPEPLAWYRRYQHQLKFLHRRVMVRPGISGLAQVRYRFDASQKTMRERLKSDIFYIENISLNLDLRIMLRSLLILMAFKRNSN